jgi:hypothetical protein
MFTEYLLSTHSLEADSLIPTEPKRDRRRGGRRRHPNMANSTNHIQIVSRHPDADESYVDDEDDMPTFRNPSYQDETVRALAKSAFHRHVPSQGGSTTFADMARAGVTPPEQQHQQHSNFSSSIPSGPRGGNSGVVTFRPHSASRGKSPDMTSDYQYCKSFFFTSAAFHGIPYS